MLDFFFYVKILVGDIEGGAKKKKKTVQQNKNTILFFFFFAGRSFLPVRKTAPAPDNYKIKSGQLNSVNLGCSKKRLTKGSQKTKELRTEVSIQKQTLSE